MTTLQSNTLDPTLRSSAAAQLCSYLANQELAERVTPVMDEVIGCCVGCLTPKGSPVAQGAVEVLAVVQQYCHSARAMLLERPTWLRAVIPLAFDKDQRTRGAALRVLAWCLLSKRPFRCVPARPAASCALCVVPWRRV